MRKIPKIKIEGFHLNENTVSSCNSVYYDRDNNEDSWIEIIPDYKEKGYIILYIENCQTIKATFATFDGLKKEIIELIK